MLSTRALLNCASQVSFTGLLPFFNSPWWVDAVPTDWARDPRPLAGRGACAFTISTPTKVANTAISKTNNGLCANALPT